MNYELRVDALRGRAAACEARAAQTTSTKFRKCYKLLAKQYLTMASIEEEYAAGSVRLRGIAAINTTDRK